MKKGKRSETSLVKRYIFLCVGLCIMAFGVAFSIEANLGTSPISSLPYVSSLLTPLSVGKYHHSYALCVYPDPDSDTPEKI